MNKFGDLTNSEFRSIYNGFNRTKTMERVPNRPVFQRPNVQLPDTVGKPIRLFIVNSNANKVSNFCLFPKIGANKVMWRQWRIKVNVDRAGLSRLLLLLKDNISRPMEAWPPCPSRILSIVRVLSVIWDVMVVLWIRLSLILRPIVVSIPKSPILTMLWFVNISFHVFLHHTIDKY